MGDFSASESILLNPEQIKSADPVTRDEQGKLIPLSERFNPANDDIRYSRPEPDMPEEDVEEEAPAPRTAQVFGRKGTAPVVPSSQARTVPIIRRDFFDGTVPVSPAATLNAAALIRTMMGRETGPAYADKLRAAVDPLDQNIAMGLLRREVDNYGLAALAAGDRSIYEMMQRYATTDWFIGKREDGTPYTYRDVAQELAGNSRLPTTKGAVARDTVNESRDEANTEGFSTALGDPDLGKKAYTDIRDTVDNTGLDEGEITGIASTPVNGKTIRQRVERTPAEPPAAEVEGEGDLNGETPETPEEDAVSQEDRVTMRYMDRVDNSQVEVLTPDRAPNPILRYIRQQETLSGWRPKDAFVRSTAAGLVNLGVTEVVAFNAAERVWLRKEARRAPQKTQAEKSEAAAKSFIAAFDKQQTESVIPTKKDDTAAVILKGAVAINREISREDFVKQIADELVTVTGISRRTALTAADRAWQMRTRRMANLEMRKRAAKLKADVDAAAARGQSLLDQLAKSQSDTQTNKPKTPDAVREVYKKALALKLTDENLRTWLAPQLAAAGVTNPAILNPLTEAIVTERRAREAVRVSKTGQALAEGRRGSLRELEKQLTETPAFLQRQPEWRRRLILDYFMQTGLSKPQAQMLARIYEAEFVKRLEEATKRAMDRLLESRVPWARKAASTPKKKKQVSDQVDKLMKAVRLGLTDPYAIWDEEMAQRNNWKGFTPTQHARLEEIDMILTQVSTLPNERARLLLEVDKMITAAKLPPKLADKILHSYVASALSGLSTTLVQGSAHVGLVMKTLATAAADPLSIPSLMKQFAAIAKTTANETAFAIKTGAYRSAPLDTLQGHERPLEYMWNRGFEQMKSDRPLDRAKGLVNIITGSQNYVMRTLSSLDQGYITGAAELSAMVFTKDLLRKIGMSRAEANAVIEETLRAKDAFYQKLRAIGETHLQASADATDVHMRRLYQTIADRDFEYDGMTAEEWAEDIRKGSVLESEGPTGRVSSAEVVGDPNSEEGARRIGPLDEGVLRRLVLWPLKGIAEAQGKGGLDALAMRSIFGFLSVPIRTAGWYAGYSPYGFVRAGIHKFQTSRGKRSPYAQTYGSKSQMQQRLREASAGSVAAVLLALLATATADDDDEKKNAIFVTGGGPSFNDMALRDAWMKRFKPYSIVVKIDGKYHAFNYGRMFESIGWAATIAGTIDDVSIRRKAKESRGGNMAMLDAFAGNILGNVVERSSFKSMVNNAVLLSRAKESGTDLRIASQATFTASALLPWKSALNTIQRVYAEPVDNNTITGSVWASTPLLGPVMGQTSVNIFGDSLGDTSPGGRFFSVGLPSFGAPRGGKAYDLVLQHGRGPSNYQRNQFSKTFETDDLDPTYREFVIRRGRKLKAAMEANYDRLKTVDTETYAEFLKRVTESINAQVASEMKLKRTSKK